MLPNPSLHAKSPMALHKRAPHSTCAASRRAPTDTAFADLARREVVALHAFFEAWYRGEDALSLDRVAGVLAPEFEMLAPNEEWITRGKLLDELSADRGAYPALTITIEHLAYRASSSDSASLEYIERHVENGQVDTRMCCALMRRPYPGSSNLEWVGIYERDAD